MRVNNYKIRTNVLLEVWILELCFYEGQYEKAIKQYQLTEEQLRYTGIPTESIELASEDIDRYAVLALEEGKLVTFFNLHKNAGVKPYSDNANAILLRTFSTDHRYLGKGYAKQALKELPSFVKQYFDNINEIVLAVNVQNDVAQSLYKKSGYVDEGERRMGKKGELIIMSYYL